MHTSALLSVAMEAALQTGALLRQGFGTDFEISSKEGTHNLVTTYDRQAESLIFDLISRRFPSHALLGEESGSPQSKPTYDQVLWIVDPLDGTVNFAHNVPVFSVSIAATLQNEVLASAVYQPMTHELFWAEKGKGAFLNGKQIHVSSQSRLDQAFLATGFPYNVHENPLHCVETFDKLARRGIPIRRLGSAALDLAYVAAGRFDGYWEVTLQPWDVAGGLLLVTEAGGVVTRYDGSPCQLLQAGTVVAGNRSLYQELRGVL